LRLFIVVSLELLFDKNSCVQCDIDLWQMLGGTSTELLEVSGVAWEIFKPNGQLIFLLLFLIFLIDSGAFLLVRYQRQF